MLIVHRIVPIYMIRGIKPHEARHKASQPPPKPSVFCPKNAKSTKNEKNAKIEKNREKQGLKNAQKTIEEMPKNHQKIAKSQKCEKR